MPRGGSFAPPRPARPAKAEGPPRGRAQDDASGKGSCGGFKLKDIHLFEASGILHPLKNRQDQGIVELAIHGEGMGHVIDFKVTGVAGMGLIDDLRDGFAVGAAHDGVGRAVDDEHRGIYVLPDFAEVQGLELLIESGGPPYWPSGESYQRDFHSGCCVMIWPGVMPFIRYSA